jgi:TolB protein
LRAVALAVVFLVLAGLACGPTTGEGAPSITITSPTSGTTVTVGEEVQIVSTAAAEAGVARVDLSINGQVVRADSPPSGNPTTFSVSQPWMPMAEGQATVSVVVYDTEGAPSEPAAITLQVVAGAADVGPTPTPVEDVEGPGGCTLNASYVADVTIPDDTELAPGTAFVKTWRIRNSGTCDWGSGFTLAFVSGDHMGGPSSVAVPATVAGSTADVSVNLTAPSAPGTYRGNWRVRSDEGVAFGSTIYVRIVVPAPTPEPTDTPIPTLPPPPSPTPFGGGAGHVAYVSFRDGNAEIYVMTDNDAAPTRLTNDPELDDWPDWSPDGNRITFQRYVGGKPEIFVMKADGSQQINLTNNPASDYNPAWSPDGTQIAFSSNRAGGALQIWVMNADGTGAIQLTNTPELNSSPAWSSDGSRIAFESTRDGQREIYIMNANGTGQTRLTFTGNNYGPDWSPDGGQIALSSGDGIWVINVDGTHLTQLTVNVGPMIFDHHPQWSPDGRYILFDSKRGGNQDLWVMNADGTGLWQLTMNLEHDGNAAWKP